MKGKWMRGLSAILSIVMLLALCPVLPAMAADVQVIMDTDFESCEVGKRPPKADGFDGKNTAVTDVARMYVEMDGDNKVLKCYHGNPTEVPEKKSPRLEKTFSMTGLTNLTISYRVKSSGESSVTIGIMEADSNKAIGWTGAPSDFKDWTSIEVQLDIKNNKSQVYVDDQKAGEAKTIKFEGREKFTVRLGASCDINGGWAMVDDFKITTTDVKYNINAAPPPKELTTPYNEADHKPESGDLLTILNEDFESQEVGKAPSMKRPLSFTGSAITSAARMYVEKDTDGNKVLKAYHGEPNVTGATARSPRVDANVPLSGLTNLTLDVDMKNSGGDTKFPAINLVHASENSPTYVSFTAAVPSTDWIHIKIRYDFVAKKAKMYIDGKFFAEKDIKTQDATSCRLRISNNVQLDGSYSMIDNVLLTTTDTDVGGIVSFDGTTVNWDKLALVENKTGLSEIMVQTHPRIYVTDWQDIFHKIETDENAAYWRDVVVADAEAMLRREPIAYYRNLRNNINDCSTDFKQSIVPVALAYKLTGDVRYKDRVYKELENVGNWPDWGSDAWLCTAHINFAFAVCYDWLYNDWTAEERANILGWLKNHGLKDAILAYEGYGPNHSWKTGGNNWNAVCNGSNIVLALAVYNEFPDAADYIIRKAAEGIPSFLPEISADGGFTEPLGYWDYALRHLTKAMAALESSIKPGTTLPEFMDFTNVRGLDMTCDFPIYYNGTTGSFNYGDAANAIIDSPLLFYMAKKFNKPEYAWYQLNIRKINPLVSTLQGKEAALSLLWYDPAYVAASDLALDKFYQSNEKYGTNGLSMRSSHGDTDAFVAMMHAGDQTASHSALDAGGFVIDWMGKRWVYMHGRAPVPNIPGGTYSWPNFHTKSLTGGHYDYYHCRGEANNTIIINPKQDLPDMNYEYYAMVERYDSAENKAFGIIDMTDTNEDYVKSRRGMMMTGDRDVLVIQDEIVAKAPSEYYWFVNCNAEITIAPDGKSALWEYNGDRMLVRMTQSPADAKFEIMPTAPLPTSPDPEIQPDIPGHKMYIHITNQQTLNLTVEFVPLMEGEGAPAPQPVLPLDSWSVDGSMPKKTSQTIDGVVALKIDNPNAFAKGKKTYVDTNNLEIKPITQNGRTLVPVRFISENIGATVSWNEATQTVGIKTKAKNITLQLGSNQMMVDDTAVTLDVPAQEIGGRTLIPLRALVEALGKQVFWDDRGLILITDAPVNYDAAKIDAIVDLLDIRVLANGQDIKYFDSEVYNYNVEIAKGAAVPTISVLSAKDAVVTQGNPATVSVGGKTYTFNFVENAFEGVLGTGSDGIAKTLSVTVKNAGALPNYQTYLDIASASSSIDWSEKYPMTGTYDGIINDETFNRWSSNGVGSWITYDLGEVKTLHSVAISGYKALSRSYKFDIEVSTDGVSFTKVCADAPTELGVDRNVFALNDVQARFVRVTGTYSSNSTWIGISEIRFYDSEQMEKDDQGAWNHYFYTSSINAMVGSVMQLEVEGRSKSGQPVAINVADVKFTSDNPEIATVDASGQITLHKTGKTIVRVEYESMGIKTNSTVDVNVEPKI